MCLTIDKKKHMKKLNQTCQSIIYSVHLLHYPVVKQLCQLVLDQDVLLVFVVHQNH